MTSTGMKLSREREIARAFLAGLSTETLAWVFSLKVATIERVLRKKPPRGYWRAGER